MKTKQEKHPLAMGRVRHVRQLHFFFYFYYYNKQLKKNEYE